jgi:hypothetical protein
VVINVTSRTSARVYPVCLFLPSRWQQQTDSAKFRAVTTAAAQRSLNFNVAITSYWIFATRPSVPSFTAATQRAQKGTKLQKGPAEILALLYYYYSQFFPVTS